MIVVRASALRVGVLVRSREQSRYLILSQCGSLGACVFRKYGVVRRIGRSLPALDREFERGAQQDMNATHGRRLRDAGVKGRNVSVGDAPQLRLAERRTFHIPRQRVAVVGDSLGTDAP